MAEIAHRYPQLNVVNLEVVAVSRLLDATVWLSPAGATGVLPGVLDAEGVGWKTVVFASE